MIVSRRRPMPQARAAEDAAQPSPKARPDRATRLAMKEDRERDAALARQEYQAERRAVLANTERLRALRLAKEANDATKKSAKAVKKGS